MKKFILFILAAVFYFSDSSYAGVKREDLYNVQQSVKAREESWIAKWDHLDHGTLKKDRKTQLGDEITDYKTEIKNLTTLLIQLQAQQPALFAAQKEANFRLSEFLSKERADTAEKSAMREELKYVAVMGIQVGTVVILLESITELSEAAIPRLLEELRCFLYFQQDAVRSEILSLQLELEKAKQANQKNEINRIESRIEDLKDIFISDEIIDGIKDNSLKEKLRGVLKAKPQGKTKEELRIIEVYSHEKPSLEQLQSMNPVVRSFIKAIQETNTANTEAVKDLKTIKEILNDLQDQLLHRFIELKEKLGPYRMNGDFSPNGEGAKLQKAKADAERAYLNCTEEIYWANYRLRELPNLISYEGQWWEYWNKK
ncbi:MAG: hypothetical protein J0L93_05835 [Deltaproteobacteria bacterium]|nr:hypothetical protein [Deltaproteobacteria bacterium]